MSCRIGFWFLKIGQWDFGLLNPVAPPQATPIPQVDMKVIKKAKIYTRECEKYSAPGTSGEFKRHIVYAKLIKDFPSVPKRQISIAIELGLE